MIAIHNTLLESAKLLPSQYRQLEYVNTNGDTTSGDAKKVNSAAAFNTGFTLTKTTVVTTTLIPGENGTGEWETYIGGTNSGDQNSNGWLLRRWGSEHKFHLKFGSVDIASPYFVNGVSVCYARIGYDLIEFDIDGTYSSVVPASHNAGEAPMWIGASGRASYGNSYRGCKALIGRTIFTDNNIVVRDYVPAMRRSDNVCGFYDLATDTFKISEVPNYSFTAT